MTLVAVIDRKLILYLLAVTLQIFMKEASAAIPATVLALTVIGNYGPSRWRALPVALTWVGVRRQTQVGLALLPNAIHLSWLLFLTWRFGVFPSTSYGPGIGLPFAGLFTSALASLAAWNIQEIVGHLIFGTILVLACVKTMQNSFHTLAWVVIVPYLFLMTLMTPAVWNHYLDYGRVMGGWS